MSERNVFFSSDLQLHFGHVNILKYGRSKYFTDLDHMRETIIHNWNNVVDFDDTVYVLGDAVMGQREKNLPHLARLHGNKILILGNHDYPHPCNKESIREKWTPLYGEYFAEMHNTLEIEIAGEKVLLCHFPAEGDHTEEERYGGFRPKYDGWIIHGHLHVEEMVVAPKHIHIGIDSDYSTYGVPRYSPIPVSAVERIMLSQFQIAGENISDFELLQEKSNE